MHSLVGKSGGCILVDGQPFQVGDLRVSYGNNTVTIKEKLNTGSSLMVTTFDQITQGVEGDPFVSMDALKSFIQSNFFADAPIKGGVFKSTVTVGSYAEMIAIPRGAQPFDVLVLTDENKGQQNTTYSFYPDATNPKLVWIASIEEII